MRHLLGFIDYVGVWSPLRYLQIQSAGIRDMTGNRKILIEKLPFPSQWKNKSREVNHYRRKNLGELGSEGGCRVEVLPSEL